MRGLLLPACFLLCTGFLALPARAAAQRPQMVDRYDGGFKDDFPVILQRVRVLAPLAQQEIATHLGLGQQANAFIHPVTIRFDDGAPAINENPFFYLQPSAPGQPFSQQLVVNVEAFARHRKNPAPHEVRNAFYYAMTELLLNDLSGDNAAQALPVWLREGLAVFSSDMGPAFVKRAAQDTTRSRARELVSALNEPVPYLGKRQYAQYYLALQYIMDTHGLDTLQQFVRDEIGGKSAADSVQDAMNQDWPAFEKEVRDYSVKAFSEAAPADDDKRPAGSLPRTFRDE